MFKKTLAIMLTAAFAVAALTTTGLSIQSTDAQLEKDKGASTFAPGQSAEQSACNGCATFDAPGAVRGSPEGPPPDGNEVGWMPEGAPGQDLKKIP